MKFGDKGIEQGWSREQLSTAKFSICVACDCRKFESMLSQSRAAFDSLSRDNAQSALALVSRNVAINAVASNFTDPFQRVEKRNILHSRTLLG
jgi:hypothetical protein